MESKKEKKEKAKERKKVRADSLFTEKEAKKSRARNLLRIYILNAKAKSVRQGLLVPIHRETKKELYVLR